MNNRHMIFGAICALLAAFCFGFWVEHAYPDAPEPGSGEALHRAVCVGDDSALFVSISEPTKTFGILDDACQEYERYAK